MKSFLGLAAAAMMLSCPAFAGPDAFETGPRVEGYGGAAEAGASALAPDTELRVAFDIDAAAKPGEVNRSFEMVGRFLNMHARAGLPDDQVSAAIVVHGPAASDLMTDAALGRENANAGILAALVDAGATVELCGQTAAYRDITEDDLLPGVSISLSAMTSHARLQQEGYTLNPF